MTFNDTLFAQVYQVAVLLPTDSRLRVCDRLRQTPVSSVQFTEKLLSDLPKISFQRAVQRLLDLWYSTAPTLSGEALAIAIESAAFAVASRRQDLDVELVWTGPYSSHLPRRRTDQVLLQLIETCQTELILISFAVYKVRTVSQALEQAINRGVNVRLIAETPESGEGKIPFGIETAFGSQIIQHSQVYIWPKHKRPTDTEGRYGSLHIKGAIVDTQNVFITSANLTEYAMTLNMEMGVLINSQELAKKIQSQIEQLILDGILVEILSNFS